MSFSLNTDMRKTQGRKDEESESILRGRKLSFDDISSGNRVFIDSILADKILGLKVGYCGKVEFQSLFEGSDRLLIWIATHLYSK